MKGATVKRTSIFFFFLLHLFLIIIYTTTNRGLIIQNQIPVVVIKDNRKFHDPERIIIPYNNKESDDLEMKYILLWTSMTTEPFVYLGEGQKVFTDRKCTHTNCFITSDRTYLGDYTKFDVIAFHGPEVIRLYQYELPKRRSTHQKYVFASLESSDNYPVCSNRFDEFFNWTWTYKLDSDVRWGYLKVKDINENVVGPRIEMHWMKLEDMDPISEELKEQLKTKTRAAAWFVSNCNSLSEREKFVDALQNELIKFNLTVDIYGACGSLQCIRDKLNDCDQIIKEKYYFYLSFENSLSEDYVSEKLLRALQFNTVPIVYGAANYTRFMPDGIYLNARELGVETLAEKIYQLMQSPEDYANYFRWRNHYSYHSKVQGIDAEEYCTFCSVLNSERMIKNTTIYNKFRQWWDPPRRC